jgi:hypothetical protein
MRPTRLPFALAVMAVLLAAPLATAYASSVQWDWTFSDGTVSASGMLATNNLSGGSYLITAIDGTWGVGDPIRQLDAVNTFSGTQLNDNLLVNGTPQLDLEGFAFTLFNGTDVNIFFTAGSYYVETVVGNTTTTTTATFSATPVPLPATLPLLLSALAGACFLGKRRSAIA